MDLRCKLALCCKTEYSNKTTEIKTSAVKICVAVNKDIAILCCTESLQQFLRKQKYDDLNFSKY